MFDPRREARRQLTRVVLPEDVEARELDPEVRRDLRSLSKDTADLVARHLVVAGRCIDEDPARALVHARAAGALAGRVGAVREAVGLTAYAAGEWADALSELRTARRITGRADHLAVVADCERALGRPERALAVLDDPDVAKLDQATRVELVVVVAGARRDLSQADAAVLLLQGPARATTARRPWAARLWYAYADALWAAGREDQAREWFAKAAEQDGQAETDAMERLLELDGVVLEDLQLWEGEEEEDVPEPPPVDLAALLAEPLAARASAAEPVDEAAEPGPDRQDAGSEPTGDEPARRVPDAVSDEVPDAVSDEVPDEVPDAVPDEVPDAVSDEVPDEVPAAPVVRGLVLFSDETPAEPVLRTQPAVPVPLFVDPGPEAAGDGPPAGDDD